MLTALLCLPALAAPASEGTSPKPEVYVYFPYLHAAGTPVLLDNLQGTWPSNTIPHRLVPSAGEAGHFAAVRFSHDATMWVNKVRFRAPHDNTNGLNCTVDGDRVVDLYVGSSTTPPASQRPDASVVVPGIPDAPFGVITFEIDIHPPVWVDEDEYLFVSIEHPGVVPTDMGCTLAGSLDDPERVDSEFWSNAAERPYSWAGLQTFGIDKRLMVEVEGVEPQ